MFKRFFEKYFGVFESFLYALFLLVMPVVYSKKIMDPVLHSRYYYYSFFLVLFAAIFAFKFFKKRYVFQFNKFQKLFLLVIAVYGIWHIITVFGAINLREAIVYCAKELSFLLGIFLTITLLANESKSRNVLIKAMVLSTGIYLAVGYYQLFDQDFSKFLSATEHISYYFTLIMNPVVSTCANKNQYADYLFMTLPFLIYGIVAFKRIWRAVSIVFLLAALLKIGLLVSKAVWAATGLFFLVFGVLLGWYLFTYFKKTGKSIGLPVKLATALLLPAFIGTTSAVVLHADVKVLNVVTDKVNQIFNPDETLTTIYSVDNPTSAQTRLIVWNKTFEMAKDNPITGVGPGNWRLNLGHYGYDEFEYDIRQGVKNFMYPHNDLFGKAAEAGFVGLAMFLFILIAVIYMSYKTIWASDEIGIKIYSIAVVGMMAGYFIDLFVTFSRIRIEHNVVFIVLASIAFYNYSVVKKGEVWTPLKNIVAKALVLGMMIFLIINLYLSYKMYQGEQMAREAYVGNIQKNWKKVLKATREASDAIYTIDPFDMPVVYYRGNAFSLNNDLKNALKMYEEAHVLHPNNIKVLNNLATAYDLTNDKTTALKYYHQALKLSPRFQDALVNLAIVQYNLNQIDSALFYIARVPVDAKATDKFKETYPVICIKKASNYATVQNIERLKSWASDKERVTSTFKRFQVESRPFDQILMEDLQ